MTVQQHAGAFSISLIFSLACKSMGARQLLALYQLLPDFCLHAKEIWAQRPSWQAYTISWIQKQAINVSLQVYQACIFFGLFLFLSGRSSFEVRLHFSWFSNTLFSADEYHVVTELTSHERSVFNDQLPKLLQSLDDKKTIVLLCQALSGDYILPTFVTNMTQILEMSPALSAALHFLCTPSWMQFYIYRKRGGTGTTNQVIDLLSRVLQSISSPEKQCI